MSNHSNSPMPIVAGPEQETLTIRAATEADRERLSRLTERDAATLPASPLLIAEAGERLLAAISLADGTAVADPFLPSGGALALLRLRFRQLQGAEPPRGGLVTLLRRAATRRRSRAALAGSPPGAGGRLLKL